VLLGLGKQIPGAMPATDLTEFDLSCSRCQMTRAEFKKRARLGCPECYNAFMGELNAITQAMHHSRQHVGKIPARQGNEARVTAQVAALQKDIETAIAKEEYEMAAALRDQIRALKEKDALEEKNALEEGGSDDA
jgi:protein arginine kinase activator